MKFVIDDRMKHRVTGVVVMMSVLAIFLPAMMKKSNQHFEESLTVSMRLPDKPSLPKVAIPQQQAMFKTVKVAHVDIQPLVESSHVPQIAKAEPLTVRKASSLVVNAPVVPTPTKPQPVANHSPEVAKAELPASDVSTASILSMKQSSYAVQLASFAQQRNAELLVTKLRSKGYKATYNKQSSKNGAFYKVIVGQVNEKTEAVDLQKKMVSLVQLNGFVVKTGVS